MPNYADDWTDKEIEKLEKKIVKEYKQAQKELEAKYQAFAQKEKPSWDKLNEQLVAGKVTADEYTQKADKLIFASKKWKSIIAEMAEDLTTVDQKVASITRSFLPTAYALNHNYEMFELEKNTNIKTSFTLYNRETVERLMLSPRAILPKPSVDIPKDLRWNRNHLLSAMTQSVLQGDDLKTTATRFQQVTDMDRRAAVRNARTAMTGAQNAGRFRALERQKDLGINVKKKWVATLDHHTRDSHAALDGKVVALKTKFPNGLMYPGDQHSNNPAELYNCRCALVADYPEYPPQNLERYDNEGRKVIKDMTYPEWLKMKEKEQAVGPAMLNLENAQKELEKLNQQIKDEGADKVFSGIWKEDVTYADYEAKKGSFDAKEQYFKDEIEKAKKRFMDNEINAFIENEDLRQDLFEAIQKHDFLSDLVKEDIITSGMIDRMDAEDLWRIWHGWNYKDRIDKFEKLLNELEDFKKNGAKFSSYFKQVDELKERIKALKIEIKAGMPTTSQFAPDAWDELVKSQAKRFTSRTTADKYFREYLDEIWDDLDDQGKYSLWQYTAGSGGLNRPLSGYNGGWDRSCFVGLDKANWKKENTDYSPLGGASDFYKFTQDGVKYDQAIVGLTKLIDQSTLPDGAWFVRGSDTSGLAGLLEGDLLSFKDAESLISRGGSDLKNAIVGQTFQNHSFLSTAIAEGSGFGGNIHYKIYAPAGTHAIYAEPQSSYGDTVSDGEMYYAGKSYRGVGGEAEMIFQRGTKFRITDVRKEGWSTTIEMEVVEQPDYFQYGDEDTFNDGATRHKH